MCKRMTYPVTMEKIRAMMRERLHGQVTAEQYEDIMRVVYLAYLAGRKDNDSAF